MTKIKIEYTIDFLKKCDKTYAEGMPIIDDDVYDKLREIVKKKYPEHEYWNEIGYGEFDADIIHKVPMNSLLKLHWEDDDKIVYKWALSKLHNINYDNEPEKVELCIQPKIDGLSCSIFYRNGKLLYAATRGDGYRGKDITANIIYVKNVPNKIDYDGDIEIRGEIFKDKEDFYKYWSKFKNPRNFAAGSIRQKNAKITKKRKLEFIAYSIVNYNGSYKDELKQLKKLNFVIPETIYCNIKNINSVLKKLIDDGKKDTYPFETDGWVIKFLDENIIKKLGYDNDGKIPKWAIALKMKPKIAISEVIDIKFTIGKSGRLTPLIFIEPVELMGSTIRKVTYHNVTKFKEDKLGIGSKVEIKKAGDIIPIISKVLTAGEKIEIPEKCPECDSKLIWNGKYLECHNELCIPILVSKLNNFVAKFKTAKGLAKKSLEKIIKKFNIHDVVHLLNLDEVSLQKEFGNIDGHNKYMAIQNIKKEISIDKVLRGLSIGGSDKLIKNILNRFNIDDNNYQELFNLSIDDIISIKGFSKKKATLFIDDLKNSKEKIIKIMSMKE